jgi:hypothetical protein
MVALRTPREIGIAGEKCEEIHNSYYTGRKR